MHKYELIGLYYPTLFFVNLFSHLKKMGDEVEEKKARRMIKEMEFLHSTD